MTEYRKLYVTGQAAALRESRPPMHRPTSAGHLLGVGIFEPRSRFKPTRAARDKLAIAKVSRFDPERAVCVMIVIAAEGC